MIARNILITAPAALPFTDQQALDQLREDMSNLAKINLYAQAAVEDVQGDCISLQLMQATYELQMNDWYTDNYPSIVYSTTPGGSGYLTLPRCPLVSITSIKYDDVNGTEQTLNATNYQLDTSAMPGRIRWASNASLPGVQDKPNSIRIRYVAGYGAASATTDQQQAAVPAIAKSCCLIRLTDLYDRRMTEGTGFIAKSDSYSNMIGKLRIPV
jgi:uncharacterized phiE125 gp8 family phage protein